MLAGNKGRYERNALRVSFRSRTAIARAVDAPARVGTFDGGYGYNFDVDRHEMKTIKDHEGFIAALHSERLGGIGNKMRYLIGILVLTSAIACDAAYFDGRHIKVVLVGIKSVVDQVS